MYVPTDIKCQVPVCRASVSLNGPRGNWKASASNTPIFLHDNLKINLRQKKTRNNILSRHVFHCLWQVSEWSLLMFIITLCHNPFISTSVISSLHPSYLTLLKFLNFPSSFQPFHLSCCLPCGFLSSSLWQQYQSQ